MKIGVGEAADAAQLLPVRNRDGALVPFDQPLARQRLQDPVDVDGGEPGGVGKLLLGHRQFVAIFLGQPGHFEPAGEFAEEMGNPGAGVPPADIDHPFAEDGAVDQRFHPQRHADPGVRQDQLAHRVPPHEGQLATGQRLHVVIGNVEQRPFQIDEIAGNVDADDLARALGRDLVAIGETGNDQAGLGRPLTLAHDIGRRFRGLQAVGESEQGLEVGSIQLRTALESLEHDRKGILGDVHRAAPQKGAGARWSLSRRGPDCSAQRWICLTYVRQEISTYDKNLKIKSFRLRQAFSRRWTWSR